MRIKILMYHRYFKNISLQFPESYVDVTRCAVVVPDEMRCHDHIIVVITTHDQVRTLYGIFSECLFY